MLSPSILHRKASKDLLKHASIRSFLLSLPTAPRSLSIESKLLNMVYVALSELLLT